MNTLTAQDDEHLRLLAIFHNVVAGLGVLFSLFPLLHLAVGVMMVTGRFGQGKGDDAPEAALFGWFFVIFPLVWIVVGLTLSTCVYVAGRYLRRRERYMFCLVTAGVMCVFAPFGTVLGVFTILVLQRQTVKDAFGVARPVAPSTGAAR